MRQKKIKQATIENLQTLGVITTVAPLTLSASKIALEIGSGKGQFITSLAKDDKETIYIALERDQNVAYRLAEKQQQLNLPNLIIICGDAKDLLIYLEHVEIDVLYLNFSDPWPKSKHHKRRLTYKTFLELYLKILKKEGILQFRTDHITFFEDSLEYLSVYFDTLEINRDLGESPYMTEYEVKKRKLGSINQFRGVRHETI